MADTPQNDPAGADNADESKLELPSLSIRRRRKKGAADPPVQTPDPVREPVLHADERTDQPTELLPVAEHHDDESRVADGEAPRERKRRKPLALPLLDARVAAPVTGVVVGLTGVLLTYLGLQGCQAVRGTTSCGGVGLFLLIAILALMVLLGATLLKAWRISDPTSSSLLAVGLVAVLAMLLFLPYIDRWFMVIVIPVLSALTYLLSWWVTHALAENADRA